MRLTTKATAAGIVEIGTKNLNGSYTCVVKLKKVNIHNNVCNFRKPTQKHINEIKADFRLESARNPVLWLKGNQLVSTDARHQALVMLDLNSDKNSQYYNKFNKVACDVFFNTTLPSIAATFYDMNMNSKRMDPWSALKAAETAKRDWAIELIATIKKFGFSMPIDEGVPPKLKKELYNFRVLKDAYDSECLEDFLNVISVFKHSKSGSLDEGARYNPFQKALLRILWTHDNYSIRQLSKLIGANSASHYAGIARELSGQRTDSSHFYAAFLTAFEEPQLKIAA